MTEPGRVEKERKSEGQHFPPTPAGPVLSQREERKRKRGLRGDKARLVTAVRRSGREKERRGEEKEDGKMNLLQAWGSACPFVCMSGLCGKPCSRG